MNEHFPRPEELKKEVEPISIEQGLSFIKEKIKTAMADLDKKVTVQVRAIPGYHYKQSQRYITAISNAGYTVKYENDQRDDDYLQIEWNV